MPSTLLAVCGSSNEINKRAPSSPGRTNEWMDGPDQARRQSPSTALLQLCLSAFDRDWGWIAGSCGRSVGRSHIVAIIRIAGDWKWVAWKLKKKNNNINIKQANELVLNFFALLRGWRRNSLDQAVLAAMMMMFSTGYNNTIQSNHR